MPFKQHNTAWLSEITFNLKINNIGG